MYPVLFKIGNFPIYSYGVLLVIAFFVGVLLMRLRAKRYDIAPDKIWDVAFWALISGVLGARIAYIFTELGSFIKEPSLLLHWRFDGLTSYGGVIGGALALIVWSRINKISPLTILDIAGGPFLIGHAIGRVGCLLNGCCYGGHCDLPWAVHMDHLPGLYHPAQIYDGLMNVAGFFVLIFLESRKLKLGQSMSIAVMIHGIARIIYEFWRTGTTSEELFKGSPITIAQSVSFLIFLAGLICFLVIQKRQPIKAKGKK